MKSFEVPCLSGRALLIAHLAFFFFFLILPVFIYIVQVDGLAEVFLRKCAETSCFPRGLSLHD